MVEFALVFPIFALLVFGIIDFGLTLNNYNSVRQGVREGAREGVVANFGTACSGTSEQKLICLVEQQIGLGSNTRVRLEIDDDYTVGETLTVCAMHPVQSVTGLFGPMLSGKVLQSKIAMRIEVLDTVDPLSNTTESALAGRDWSWC
jgi:hypothetical protein